MAQDQFFQQILKALEGPLDPKAFEACACELVRMDFPGVVSVPGGQDSGMDGAIPDLDGEAFPLICTTSEDVIGNLTGSLDSYLASNGRRRKIVVATSRSLTPTRRRNLEERAQEKGFTLVNVYEQQSVAERLYRNSKWCKELLNLTGQPPALSKIPPNPRADLTASFVGREEDLKWLKERQRDCVLSGQPGSGKTHLLRQIISSENSYFLTGDTSSEIAAAIRDNNPVSIIVDDAHTCMDDLATLQKIRKETGSNFKIVAITWPNGLKDLQVALSIGTDDCRELRLLTRDEIVEVIKSCSIHGPDQLIHEIVNQAEGKPGLAVLLSFLCISGNIKRFWTGDLLSQWVLFSLARSLGEKPEEILAAFSLGGDEGLNLSSISRVFNIPLVQVRKIVANLAAAGIVTEVGDKLSVRPPALRYALVRDVFFSGATSLDPVPFYSEVSNSEELASTIVHAAHRGANIPDHIIFERVVSADAPKVWESYAWLGKRQTLKVLEEFPQYDQSLIEPGLNYCPEKMLPRMFERAIGDNRPLNSNPDHPIRKIQDWISHVWPKTPEAVERKRQLLNSVISWLDSDKENSVAYQVLPEVFQMGFRQDSMDPGGGNTFQLRHGVLDKVDVVAIGVLWDRCFQLLSRQQSIEWKYVIDAVEHVLYIGRHPSEIEAETLAESKRLAAKMISDLATIVGDKSGVKSQLMVMAENLGITTGLTIDTTFETLFPSRDTMYEDKGQSATKKVKELSERWKTREPREVARDLNRFESEAKNADLKWPRLTPHLVENLATSVSHPMTWAQVFYESGLPTDLVCPFWEYSMLNDLEGWQQFATQNIGTPLKHRIVQMIFVHPNPPVKMLNLALDNCSEFGDSIEYLTARAPLETLKRLLQHESPNIRGHAAIGEWNMSEKHQIRTEVEELWRDAIVNFDDHDYWLNEILRKDTDLAFKWTMKQFTTPNAIDYEKAKLITSLCPTLSTEQRSALLDHLPDGYYGKELILDLVQDDDELCAKVFASENLDYLRLYLVEWKGGPGWEQRVIKAIESGYDIDEVSYHVIPSNQMWWGNESEMWKGWQNTFNPLLDHSDERIRTVGQKVKGYVQERIDRALKREESRAVYGRRF
ncbi:hypothetical protein ACNQKP_10880 [Bdellovibrio bacteriovorus]|uniref:hypothetical protein n=1 Tax=Bdellovibrio bacteriovorus TaxID=959 RepID=UPI003AA8F9F9